MAVRRIYGIKYPFTDNNDDGRFIDVNKTLDEKTASEIMHVILTNKRTRLRRPDFGTNLIKYVFEDNMSGTWDAVRDEIITSVSRYVPYARIVDVEVYTKADEDNSVYLSLKYQVTKGNTVENKELVTRL